MLGKAAGILEGDVIANKVDEECQEVEIRVTEYWRPHYEMLKLKIKVQIGKLKKFQSAPNYIYPWKITYRKLWSGQNSY